MIVKQLRFVAGLCIGLILLPLSTADARARCRPELGAHVVASTSRVLVWKHSKSTRHGQVKTTYWYGCVRKRARRTLLARSYIDYALEDYAPRPTHLRLAGHFVAFALHHVAKEGQGTQAVVVANLRAGRRILRLRLHSYDNPDGDPYRFEQLAVSSRGFVAWRDADVQNDAFTDRIWAHDSHGTRELDFGRMGEFSGFTLVDQSVRWRKNGASRSAALS